jgi:hypothetical protein
MEEGERCVHHSACESRVCMSVVFSSSQSSSSELKATEDAV